PLHDLGDSAAGDRAIGSRPDSASAGRHRRVHRMGHRRASGVAGGTQGVVTRAPSGMRRSPTKKWRVPILDSPLSDITNLLSGSGDQVSIAPCSIGSRSRRINSVSYRTAAIIDPTIGAVQ